MCVSSLRMLTWSLRLFLAVASFSTCFALSHAAQADSVPARTISESDADVIRVTWPDVVRVVDQHPRLAAGRYKIDAAQNGVKIAGAVPNPTLEGNFGKGIARTGDASRSEWELALTMPLGWLAQRGPMVRAAAAEVGIAEAENKALRRDVLLQLKNLFWTLVYDQARVASIKDLESQTHILAQTIRKLVEKEELRPVEVTRIEIEVEKISSELDAARTSLSARQAEIALWLSIPEGKTVMAVADLDALPVVMDRNKALSMARATHPVLEMELAKTRFLKAEVRVEKMARVPSLSVTGFKAGELDRRAYGIGLAIDIPIWNWNTARIAQAKAKLAEGQKLAEAVERELEMSVIDTQAACQSSTLIAMRFRNNVVPRAEAAASMMEKTYQLGEATLLELIDARRTLLDSRRLYLSALVQAQIDYSRLSALVGEEPK